LRFVLVDEDCVSCHTGFSSVGRNPAEKGREMAVRRVVELNMQAQLAALDAILGEKLPSMDVLRVEDASSCEALALVNMATQIVLLDGDRMKRMLARVAKSKIADGTYCECSACDGEISVPRLVATPYAILCIECQTKREDGVLENDPFELLVA
jgi:DnaK suppressor protein